MEKNQVNTLAYEMKLKRHWIFRRIFNALNPKTERSNSNIEAANPAETIKPSDQSTKPLPFLIHCDNSRPNSKNRTLNFIPEVKLQEMFEAERGPLKKEVISDLGNFSKNNPYEMLCVSGNTEKKEISRTYKRLKARFNPDKFASEPLEKIKEATKFASLLNWARG